MNTPIIAIYSCISLLLLLLIFEMYKKYCLDNFRHLAFNLRDDLFDYWKATGYSWSHPGYTMIRSSINATIHFAESVSITQALCFFLMLGKTAKQESNLAEKYRTSKDGLPPEVVVELDAFRTKTLALVIFYMVRKSPLVFMAVPLFFAYESYIGLAKLLRPLWPRFEYVARVEARTDAHPQAAG